MLRSLRSLYRQPAFSVPALATIALGIGVTTAVFSLVYAILLRPFPYPDSNRLVRVFTLLSREAGSERNCSLLDIEDYNRRFRLIENFGAYVAFDSQIEGDGAAHAVIVGQLNQEALRALAVVPVLGRLPSQRRIAKVDRCIRRFSATPSGSRAMEETGQ